MKQSRTIRFLFPVLAVSLVSFFSLFIVGCRNDNPASPHGSDVAPAGTLISTTACKRLLSQEGSSALSPGLDCVHYEYDGQDVLTLKHMNAGFNCCPGEITADIDIKNQVITFVERESEHACRCLCLIDANYRIEHVKPGRYEVKFVEPYTEPSDDPLEFTCDLSQVTSNVYCVERTHYPWDVP